jgi:hypothetical protein
LSFGEKDQLAVNFCPAKIIESTSGQVERTRG